MAQPKQISQETFDGVVRENIEEFEMELNEAIEDAKEQFRTQGVDLSNLITSYIKDPDSGNLKHTNPVKGEVDVNQASAAISNPHIIFFFFFCLKFCPFGVTAWKS